MDKIHKDKDSLLKKVMNRQKNIWKVNNRINLIIKRKKVHQVLLVKNKNYSSKKINKITMKMKMKIKVSLMNMNDNN